MKIKTTSIFTILLISAVFSFAKSFAFVGVHPLNYKTPGLDPQSAAPLHYNPILINGGVKYLKPSKSSLLATVRNKENDIIVQ